MILYYIGVVLYYILRCYCEKKKIQNEDVTPYNNRDIIARTLGTAVCCRYNIIIFAPRPPDFAVVVIKHYPRYIYILLCIFYIILYYIIMYVYITPP